MRVLPALRRPDLLAGGKGDDGRPAAAQADTRPQPIDPDANFPSRAIVKKKTLHLPDWSLIALTDAERGVHDTSA